MEIKASEIKMVAIKDIIPRDNNRNKHPKEQIKRMAEIIRYQGFRRPLVISNLSGKLVCGHLRLLAAKDLGMKKVPVIYQDYDNEDMEYSDHVADNSIALWSESDFAGINLDIADLGPDFDIDMLGLANFTIDRSDKPDKKSKPPRKCPECGYEGS